MEIWRDIEGYEGLYQVSNEGRVRSLDRDIEKIRNGKKFISHLKGRIKKQDGRINKRYICHYLWKNGEQDWFLVHQLVAKAFIPNPNGYTVVHHKDNNPENNYVENLEWISDEDHRLLHTNEKSKQIYQYNLDGDLVKIWSSIKECGRNGFDTANVSRCCNPKYESYKTYKGFKWRRC